jgi:kynurenine formamidase
VYDLAHVLHQDIPAFPGRTFRQYLTTNYHQINRRHPDAGPAGLGHNSVNSIVEQATATQQMGTHMDGLNHLQIGDRICNGFLLADIVEDHGTNRLGIGTLPQVVTRGLLLDVAASRGSERLQPGDVITVADAEQALTVSGHDVRPGDAVFFHTGWGSLWGADNERGPHWTEAGRFPRLAGTMEPVRAWWHVSYRQPKFGCGSGPLTRISRPLGTGSSVPGRADAMAVRLASPDE